MGLQFGMNQQGVLALPPSGYTARWQFEDNLIDDVHSIYMYNDSANEDYVTGGKPSKAVRKTLGDGYIYENYEFSYSGTYPIFEFGNSWSISFWYKTDKISDGGNINYGCTGGFHYDSSGIVTWNTQDGQLVFFITRITGNTWYHFVITCDATDTIGGLFQKCRVYLNGNSTSIADRYVEQYECYDGIGFLRTNYVSGASDKHYLESLYLYPFKLSTSQIAQLYNAGEGV